MADKADVREEPVKRGKGRPKLQEGEKGQYNVSSRVKARRAAQKTVTQSKRTAEKHRNKAQAAKNRAERAKDRLKKVESAIYTQNGAKILEEDVLNGVPKQVKDLVESEAEVIFKPNAGPQTDFLASPERDVFYGGAAGGGKSFALLADLLRYCNSPNHRALIIRRTLDELTELVDKSKQLYPKAFPGAVFREAKAMWQFPSGATAWFSYLDKDKDVTRYQGQAFTWIGIDEITHYPTSYVWEYLRSRLRTTDPAIQAYMRCTGNPGGVGGWWVKKMYIDPAPPNTPFAATDVDSGNALLWPDTATNGKAGQPLFLRKFIPARLTDNPYLAKSGEYEAMLRSLPEVERRRLLEGDWDVAEGAAFPEFSRNVHVVDASQTQIPANWLRLRAADYGYSAPACVLWGAIDWDDNLWIYREFYGKGQTAETLANIVSSMEGEDPTMYYTVLDSSCWNKTGTGPSIAETMIRAGVRWTPSDRNRIAGKMELHRRLQIDEVSDEPRIKILSTCTNLIRTLSGLPLSKTNTEDVDTKADDHAYDALRYMCMTRARGHLTINSMMNKMKEGRPKTFDATFGY
jgi:hypothetical protein|tara:strand:+ start:22189 stop:23910 length:1722 start_codon:yes stop_codon:yes gene_type:complete